MTANPEGLKLVCDIVREKAAIVLGPEKQYLIEARLKPVCDVHGLASLDELFTRLRTRDRALVTSVVEAMTTNETSFFRDVHPFDALRDEILPEAIERRQGDRELSIWCAASSSGQEPVSIALTIRENFPELASWKIRILGTDINDEMIRRCREGVYSQLDVSRGLPAKLLVKYFTKDGMHYRVNREILQMLEYRQLNLAEPFVGLGQMDIVFMRNVLIYFDAETKASILEKARRVMRPGAVLFLGAAESTLGLETALVNRPCDKATVLQAA